MKFFYLPIIFLFLLSSCGDGQRDADKSWLVEVMLEEDYARTKSDAECFVEFLDELEDIEWQVLFNDLYGEDKYDAYDESFVDNFGIPYDSSVNTRITKKIRNGNRFCNTFLR